MAYLEPGAYSQIISTLPNSGTGGPMLLPLVIGTGAKKLIRTEVIVRSEDDTDVLPVEAVEIKSIGYTPNKADFIKTTDYTLDATNKNTINWVTEGNSPKAGESYCVTFSYEVGAEQFALRYIEGLEQLKEFYGSDLKTEEGNEINNLYVAASILIKSGCPQILVQQVNPGETGTVTGEHYTLALEANAAFVQDVWRIIPADLGADINSAIDGHIKKYSSYEERMERNAVYTVADGHTAKTATELIQKVGGYADSKNNPRVTVTSPCSATMIFSDGNKRELTGQFVAAAYAGVEGAMPRYMSKTRSTSGVFYELLGPKLTRTEKNKLAESGVLIFEQPNGPGTDCVIRHQLTTDMSSAETRENSVLACKDYTSKYLRGICETYIGKHNITADTITRIRGSVSTALVDLAREGWILPGGQLTAIYQDTNNPDSLIIEVKISVPYPCNYIKITIVV